MAEVKQSINKIQICGALSEINMKVETKEVTLKSKGTEKKVTCRTIGKADFKNPSLTVEANIGDNVIIVGGSFFQTHEKKIDDKGNVVDNPRFKALETIMGYATKTRIKIDGSLEVNEYATDQGEFKSFPQINIFQCSSTGLPEEDIAEGKLTGIIRTIKDEVRGEAQEETGRLDVEVYTFNNQGIVSPHRLFVEEDLADAFKDMYNNGDSVELYYEILTKQIGGKTVAKEGGFGRRDSKVVNGFSVTEYSVFKGEEPFDEESEYFIPLDAMKTAMKARDIVIEQKIKDAKEKKNAPKETKGKGLGSKAPKAEHVEEEDDLDSCPF